MIECRYPQNRDAESLVRNEGRKLDYSLEDLVLAYRKAKVDLHYSSDQRVFDLLDYEQNLAENLRSLVARLNSKDESWVDDPDFLGGIDLVPKRLRGVSKTSLNAASESVVYSSPARAWRDQAANADAVANFRPMSRCSIAMHVLSALWVQEVGGDIDEALSASSYGNRVRRLEDGEVSRFSQGSFVPYVGPYRAWQDHGIDAMEAGLRVGRRVTVLTADVTSFYHRLDPDFIGDDEFLSGVLGVNMDPRQDKTNRLLLRAIKAWRHAQEDFLGGHPHGLPVGLSASSIIANVALIGLDRALISEVRPRYYGRYVDDLIIVIDDAEDISSVSQLWQWIADRVQMSTQSVSLEVDQSGARYVSSFLGLSDIRFDNEKNKLYLLDPGTGQNVVDSIKSAIADRASEWRMMPVLPENASDVGLLVARARQSDGESAGSLRAADTVSTSRSAFALTLRDFESFARELDPPEWVIQRHAFLVAVRNHVFAVPTLFEMDQYVVRVLRLAFECGDREHFLELLDALVGAWGAVVESSRYQINGVDSRDSSLDVELAWARHIRGQVQQAVLTVGPVEVEFWNEVLGRLSNLAGEAEQSLVEQVGLHARLFSRDLAARPFRTSLLPDEFSIRAPEVQDYGASPLPIEVVPRALRVPLERLAAGLASLGGAMKSQNDEDANLERHPALVFPTRPFNSAELFALSRILSPAARDGSLGEKRDSMGGNGLGSASQEIHAWLFAARGYAPSDSGNDLIVQVGEERLVVSIPNTPSTGRGGPRPSSGSEVPEPGDVRVALSMFETSADEAVAATHGVPMLTASRHRAFARSVNAAMAISRRPDYLVFGELAVPIPWFLSAAIKLAPGGTSLISGVEYIRSSEGLVVHNQVWFSLVTTIFGFKSIALYRQDKQNPAHQERRNLADHQGLTLQPAVTWAVPPVVQHGSLWFASVVCSELTNIDYRSSLRGSVDLLFVPEWNQDLHTFEALVESAALDLHAYIVQVNNRLYGDSRVRVPRGKEHERDLVRLRGGRHDYVVAVDLDIRALRAFHAQLSSASKEFKPLPDGFRMSSERWLVPRARDAR